MAASQQAGDWVMACTYGIALLEILGMQKIPEKEMARSKASSDELGTWQKYYQDILMTGIGRIKTTIDAVRVKYKADVMIPKYKTPGETN